MFDGIKNTLREFRSDVEETAESVDDAEADESEPEDPPEAIDEGDEDDKPGLTSRARSLARGRVVIDESDLDAPLRELELALISNDVEMSVVDTILDRVRSDLVGESRGVLEGTTSVVEAALRDALVEVLRVGEFDFDEQIAHTEPPVVIIFTGVNGVGKTTTIAKLAVYLENEGYSTVLANGDTFRAGANEQLREHAERVGKKFISHERGGDPTAVIYDAVEYAKANSVDVVLGDTAGRLHTNEDLMNQLAKINRVIEPDFTLFVDEAVAGQDAVQRAREFNSAAEIDGSILTKADADTRGGAAISIAQVTGKPIVFLGTGQEYDDLEPFDPESIADRLLGDG